MKLYPCTKCGRMVRIRSKSLCQLCRSRQLIKKEDSGFFSKHLSYLKKYPYSQESGKLIVNVDRRNICHILPKRKNCFPSLKYEDDNIIYLTWQEHSTFDRYIDTYDYKRLEEEFPKVWLEVLKVLPKLIRKSKEKNKMYYKLLEYLG